MIYLIIAVIAIVTALTRFLPFILFTHKTPKIINALGIMLPASLVAMIFVYSSQHILENLMQFGNSEFVQGIYGIIGIIATLLIHILFKNILLSIIGGTIIYLIICNYELIVAHLQL